MPELPEVETVRRGLAPVTEGAVITRAETHRPDLRWPFPERMAERLTGARVLRMNRRSKYLLAELDTGETLIIHLGMSGRILIEGQTPARFYSKMNPLGKHDHVSLEMDNGTRIVMNDPRRFGAMDLCPTDGLARHRFLAHLGPEPLSNSFDEAYLAGALRNRNTPIKSALLDQRVVAGLGNIYVCEALWRAHISPIRKAGRVSEKRVAPLVPAIRSVLTEAITAGGSSLKDFRQTDGDLGYFQHNFAVYDREAQDCANPDCTGKIRRIVQSGRSTFYCATCQR